jgi:hypothetical protein
LVVGFKLSLALARQAFYHLSHTPSSFCFSYFLNRVSHYAQVSMGTDPFIYVSHIAWVTVRATTTSFLLVKMGSNRLFCPGWPQIAILLPTKYLWLQVWASFPQISRGQVCIPRLSHSAITGGWSVTINKFLPQIFHLYPFSYKG